MAFFVFFNYYLVPNERSIQQANRILRPSILYNHALGITPQGLQLAHGAVLGTELLFLSVVAGCITYLLVAFPLQIAWTDSDLLQLWGAAPNHVIATVCTFCF